MFKLNYPSFIDPRWFNGLRSKPEHQGTVLADEMVDVNGERLRLKSGELPDVGTVVMVSWGSHDMTGELVTEFQARKAADAAALEIKRKAEEAADSARREAMQRQAEERNAKLRIPVRWTSGFKAVLSGLQEGSWGDGHNRRSVAHILLLEAIKDGRFSRPANGFLCTTESRDNGMKYTSLDDHSVGVHGPYVSEINCRQCLKVAARWRGATTWQKPELPAEGPGWQRGLKNG